MFFHVLKQINVGQSLIVDGDVDDDETGGTVLLVVRVRRARVGGLATTKVGVAALDAVVVAFSWKEASRQQ